MRWTPALVALAVAAPASAAHPLFASDDPIRFTLAGPIASIARSAEDSTAAKAGTLTSGAEVLPVLISARGITRRKSDVCQFPPLRVEFAQKPGAASLFAGEKRLKLVTHCRSAADFQQYVLMEYSAYRLFNLISPVSFRARLALVNYVDAGGKPIATRYGFFIEDKDDVAKRNNLPEARVGERIASASLEPKQAARVALFEYMISNLDWSMSAGPKGEPCCHNARLATGPGGTLVPYPYDFDYSGLVNAPYAVPPDGFSVSNVRKRVWRGYCRNNADVIAAAAEFRAKRPQMEALFGQIPGLDGRTARNAVAYLGGFFNDIASDEAVKTNLLKRCIG